MVKGEKQYFENKIKEYEKDKAKAINDLITYIQNGGKSHFIVEIGATTINCINEQIRFFEKELVKVCGKGEN